MLPLGIITGSFLLVGLWEWLRPRRRREFPAVRRRLGNIGFWILNLLIAGFFAAPDSSVRTKLAAALGLAVPSWPIAKAWLSMLSGFLLLDLIYYLVHRCQHKVPFLWRFHALHHSDPDVDVTTSVRHHPVEMLLNSAIYWIAVLVLDIPVAIVMIHGLAVFGTAAVQHGNIRISKRLERWLQPVLVTVDLHRVHHSISAEQANSNYGAVLSLWDRLFGTLTRITPAQHQALVFGVAELPRRDCLRPSAMLMTPWRLGRARTRRVAPSG